MTGLAFGRVGCLLNGCCYGAPVSENYPLAMRFPYASTPALKLDSKSNAFGGASVSPAFSEQVEPVVRELPANADESAVAAALTRHGLDQRASSVLGRAWQLGDFSALTPQEQNRARDALASLPTGSSRQAVSNALAAAGVDPVKASLAISPAGWVVRSPASLAGAEVDQALAVRAHALQPSQALGIANGLILAAILLAYSRLRRREGQVIALLLVMYPVTRFLLEMIRGDNPHNLLTLTFTHNQFTSMVMLAAGVIVFYVISRLPASAGAFWPDRVAAAGLVQSASPRKGNV
jgi:phosphatidylglycerol:prolipoprotein diacylglycerol transferase